MHFIWMSLRKCKDSSTFGTQTTKFPPPKRVIEDEESISKNQKQKFGDFICQKNILIRED